MAACVATCQDGRPCRMVPIRGQSYCFQHLPGEAAEQRRRAAQRLGGQRSWEASLRTLEGQRRALQRLVSDLQAGRVSPKKGDAMLRALKLLIEQERRRRARRKRRVVTVVQPALWLEELVGPARQPSSGSGLAAGGLKAAGGAAAEVPGGPTG